jgi:hypothetical protein
MISPTCAVSADSIVPISEVNAIATGKDHHWYYIHIQFLKIWWIDADYVNVYIWIRRQTDREACMKLANRVRKREPYSCGTLKVICFYISWINFLFFFFSFCILKNYLSSFLSSHHYLVLSFHFLSFHLFLFVLFISHCGSQRHVQLISFYTLTNA